MRHNLWHHRKERSFIVRLPSKIKISDLRTRQCPHNHVRPISGRDPREVHLALGIRIVVEIIGYSDTLDKKMWSHVHEVNMKDGNLALTQMIMTNAEVAFAEENKTLGSSYKMKQKMKTSLKKAQEGWNKIEDDLQEMRLENLALSKEYTKLVEDSFCCTSIF